MGRQLLEATLSCPDAGDRCRYLCERGTMDALIPEFTDCVGFDQQTRYHSYTVDEHIFAAVAHAAACEAPLYVRLAMLLHDIGKPASAFRGDDGWLHYGGFAAQGIESHQAIGARMARTALARLGYPTGAPARPGCTQEGICALITEHMFADDRETTSTSALRFVGRVGRPRALALLAIRAHDAAAKPGACGDAQEARRRAFESLVVGT